jgi:hypothetical protein
MTAQNLPPDYLDAMERHWLDAEDLFDRTDPRLANADQLYGLSAECGLKALMMKWGMTLNSNNLPTDGRDRKHADLIWDRYATYRQGLFTTLALPPTNPFDDWSIHHRYAHQSYFQKDVVKVHKQGAAVVQQIVKEADKIGVLP